MAVRVAIVGVGNCAKSLVEGVAFYRLASESTGLSRAAIGPYAVGDIEFVCAFDIDRRKVGRRLSEAVSAEPNETRPLVEAHDEQVIVQRGPTLDGVEPTAGGRFIDESVDRPVDVKSALSRSGADIVVNYLPAGSEMAAKHYAIAAYEAGASFVNCMSATLARDQDLARRFAGEGLVLLGDDIKSQVGATVVNRMLLQLLHLRGARIVKSRQANRGGNADHYNLQFRPHSKEVCKREALASAVGEGDAEPEVSMRFEPELGDHKKATILIDAEIFGRAPVSLRVELDDEDSPNSAGVVVDAVRVARLMHRTQWATLAANASAMFMKAPAVAMQETDAVRWLDWLLHSMDSGGLAPGGGEQ